ncbi:Serine/threonine-protein kinase NEK [Giardia duodenalis]|uniref:non-specific serine/threonine protein kinase n=1 Tax=Giardia intestinalis TaxID=5741 RepID=V6T9Q0_GIAIN|nr:Serine/threonine-protein kinase NEK [Giardia intestinalis]
MESACMEDYESLGLIGQGGFGKVYKVRSLKTNEIFACKEIDYGCLSDKYKEIQDNELKLLISLKHPNIVHFTNVYKDPVNEVYYMLMEFCDKGDLSDLIKHYRRARKDIPESTIWIFAYQLLNALEYCHSPFKENCPNMGRVVHRDIKPENILRAGEVTVKFADFGICRTIGDGIMATTNVGTTCYMAPELLKGQEYNEKIDIWALGCALYELCTKQRMFVGKGTDVVLKQIDELPRPLHLDNYSQELCLFIDMMLTVDFSKRPAANELLRYPKIQETGEQYNSGKVDLLKTPAPVAPSVQDVFGTNVDVTGKSIFARDRHAAIHAVESVEIMPSSDLLSTQGQKDSVGIGAAPTKSIASAMRTKEELLNPVRSLPAIQDVQISISRDKYGNTPLMLAAASGNLASVLQYMDSQVGLQNQDCKTALMMAAENNHLQIVRFLLEAEAGKTTDVGDTALIIAATQGHTSIVELLVEYEAGLATNAGWTALMKAATGDHHRVARLLKLREMKKQTGNGLTALMIAAAMNSEGVLQELIEEEYGMQDSEGKTALIFATINGHLQLVKWLAPYEYSIRDNKKQSALDYARASKDIDVQDFLTMYDAIALRGSVKGRRKKPNIFGHKVAATKD